MSGTDPDYEDCKLIVAAALRALERSLHGLTAALSHADVQISVKGTDDPRAALQQVGDAYCAIEFVGDRDQKEPDDVLGVVGVPADVLARAAAVNEAKDRLKEACTPLYERRRAVPGQDKAGRPIVKQVPWVRLMMRELGRPRLNLLAAYRRIPILEKRPLRVAYVQARTRAVYRRSRDELIQLLSESTRIGAAEDIVRLRQLPSTERYLAEVRGYHQNTRANIRYPSLDTKARGRVQIHARLPILYPRGRSKDLPLITYPGQGAPPPLAGSVRQRKLREEAFLSTMTVHRYADPVHARTKGKS